MVLSTDQQLREYQPQRLEWPAEDSPQPRILQLWEEAGNPVKITATEPDDSGQMQGLSSFYFANGELFFVTQPYAHFIFIGEDLKYWLDDNWEPLEVPEQDRKQREILLQQRAKEYLNAFTN